MTVEYDNFMQDCITNLPSSVPMTIEPELAMVLRDFCQQTNAWRAMYKFPVDTEHTCYVVQPPQGAAVNLLHGLFDAADPDRKPVVYSGVQMRVPGHIDLMKPPSAPAQWVADVSLYPTRELRNGSSCKAVIPGWLLERYYDTLLHGVLGRMMRQPLKPYTNLALGSLHGASYGAGRAATKAELAVSNVWGSQQWRQPAATTAMTYRQRAR